MRRDSINYLVVGVFVLVVFVAFLAVLYQITGRSGPTDDYIVSYGNVEGIKYGTPVLYEGYQIGQVDDLEPVRESAGTEFQLTLAVVKGWQIPSDSIAKVVKSGLLSAVAIDIKEGQSTRPLSPGDSIAGEPATDIFAAVNDVAADIKDLSRNSLRPLLDNMNVKVDELSGDVRGLLGDSVRPLLDQDVKTLVTNLNVSADRLTKILSSRNQENIDTILSNLEAASDNLAGLMLRVDSSRESLDSLLGNLNTLVDSNDEDIRTIVKDMQKSLYSVSQHIDAVSHNLEGSSRNINEFTRQIRENPALLIKGSPQNEPGGTE